MEITCDLEFSHIKDKEMIILTQQTVKTIKNFSSVIFLAALFMLAACNGDDDNGGDNGSGIGTLSYTPSSCSAEGQNEFVYRVMTDTYLWYDKVVETDYANYDSPGDMLNDIRYKELDKWTYITSKQEYHTYYEEGKFIGIGYGSKYDNNGDLRVRFVYKNSPADAVGLKRGDKILEINGVPVEEIETNNLWNTIHGKDEVGVTVNMRIEDLENVVRDFDAEKEWVTINTVLNYELLEIEGLKIGYLNFLKFLETSQNELNIIFAYFKQEDIDDLILDLRYNTGGRNSTARYLASLIAGDNADRKIFKKYIHNEKHSDWNRSLTFFKPANALNLNRIVVITSDKTCSASELVINSLKPFIDVILVGARTCGKPVGMYGHDFCDKHIAPVEFRSLNAYDEGDYFDGIPADCYASDDLTMPFGDTRESSLSQALHYIVNGSCSNYRPKRRIYEKGEDKEIYLHGFRGEIDTF